MTEPPYLRIASEIRARIAAGELAPGARVPSTRDIVRDWDVAMATATKVLTTLRRDGLVRTLPGVGTVVAGRAVAERVVAGRVAGRPTDPSAPRRRPGEGAVDRAAVVASAITIADAEGLAALSMRRVAADLGVATMSLYRHVEDKDDLLVRMLDAAIGEVAFPPAPPTGTRSRLETAARLMWKVFRCHPWVAPAMSLTRPQLVPNALVYTEWVLGALAGRGLDVTTVFHIHLTLFNYVRGTAVNLEPEREAQAQTGLDSGEWMDEQEGALRAILAPGGHPHFERLIEGDFDLDLDVLFEFGLQRLLDGFGTVLTGRAVSR